MAAVVPYIPWVELRGKTLLSLDVVMVVTYLLDLYTTEEPVGRQWGLLNQSSLFL